VEHHDVIDAVEELMTEVLLQLVIALVLHPLIVRALVVALREAERCDRDLVTCLATTSSASVRPRSGGNADWSARREPVEHGAEMVGQFGVVWMRRRWARCSLLGACDDQVVIEQRPGVTCAVLVLCSGSSLSLWSGVAWASATTATRSWDLHKVLD
jgi:hypothetical protein